MMKRMLCLLMAVLVLLPCIALSDSLWIIPDSNTRKLTREELWERTAAMAPGAAQDALIEELYAEPEPENSGETAEGTESKESEGAEPSAESEATE